MSPETKPAPDQPPPLEPALTERAPLPRSKQSIIGFILAFVIPPLGAIISIIAWREIKQKSLRGKKLAVFGTIWGLAFTLPFLFFVWLFIVLGGLKGNGAQSASKPFIAQIKQAGGKKLCDNGDSGYGIDNTTQWYDAYYQIPNSPGLTNEIKGFASQDGYNVTKDTATIYQLQGKTDLIPNEQFNSRSDYLIGHNGDKTLTITINRQISVPLYCSNVGTYGQKRATGNDTAILSIHFELPDTSR